MIDLVAKDDEGSGLELVHSEKGIKLGFRFIETLVVFCVDKEDYTGDFGDWMRLVDECWRNRSESKKGEKRRKEHIQ